MADEVKKEEVVITQPESGKQGTDKLFTQAELDAAIASRLSRENIKDLKAKAAELEQLKQSQMSELDKAKNDAENLKQQLAVANQQILEISLLQKKEELLDKEGLPRSFAKRISGSTDEEIAADVALLKNELGIVSQSIGANANPGGSVKTIGKGKPSMNELLHRAIGGY